MDKLLHFLVGAVIALAFGYLLPAFFGLVAAVFAGAAKELYDHFRPLEHTADFWDFVATLMGGCSGYAFLIYV